ncbi:MAG: BlaI/MecI/CopY family transcriptional regulator [Actinomycetota bacterium]
MSAPVVSRGEGRIVPKLTGQLGPLERSIMEVVWDRDDDVTVRDLLDTPDTRELAYTTVMTVMDRLWRKGLLSRGRAGRAYVYRFRITREQYVSGLVGQVLASAQDRRTVLLGFVRGVSESDREELRKLIRKVEREHQVKRS